MLDKKVLKDIQSLKLKKHRQERGLFMAEGPKIVDDLLHVMPAQIVALYAIQSWKDQRPRIPAVIISEGELERMSGLQAPNEVVAILRTVDSPEPVALAGTWSVYLDTIQDPGNFGTIIRACDWFGVSAIVCSTGCAELYNPKVVQATMGSIARVPVWYDVEGEWLGKQPGNKLAAVLNGPSVYEVQRGGGGILVIGNESGGVSAEVLKACTGSVSIPKRGGAESLNAGVAAGILLSYLVR